MLPRLVGLARALEIVSFDKPISSEQALVWGLTTKVVEDGRSVEEAVKIAHEMAKGSLNSFGWSKQLLTGSFNTAFGGAGMVNIAIDILVLIALIPILILPATRLLARRFT
jgi:enoyl-CoA hydratase/carnithine racemase